MPSFGSIVCLTVRRSDAFLNRLFPLKEAVTKQIVIILPVKGGGGGGGGNMPL